MTVLMGYDIHYYQHLLWLSDVIVCKWKLCWLTLYMGIWFDWFYRTQSLCIMYPLLKHVKDLNMMFLRIVRSEAWGGYEGKSVHLAIHNSYIDAPSDPWYVTTSCLTHWGRDKMAAISQTTLSNAFSWIKILEFRLKFHWNLLLRVQLTIFQHWFR